MHREYVMQPVQGQAKLMWVVWKKSSRTKVPTLSVTGDMDKLEVRTYVRMCMHRKEGITVY